MLVTAEAQDGTIGGGRLEWDCVAMAHEMLLGYQPAFEQVIVLGPEIGQCCGGTVTVRIEPVMDLAQLEREVVAATEKRPHLYLFGAGHVGRALTRALAMLPLRMIWIDARPDSFGAVPDGVEIRITGDWAPVLAEAPVGSSVIVMTQSHALDALIIADALERGDFRYVGLIGSMTKRRRFEQEFRALGLDNERIATLICPIGGTTEDKRPECIAALVAAEIVMRCLKPAT